MLALFGKTCVMHINIHISTVYIYDILPFQQVGYLKNACGNDVVIFANVSRHRATASFKAVPWFQVSLHTLTSQDLASLESEQAIKQKHKSQEFLMDWFANIAVYCLLG